MSTYLQPIVMPFGSAQYGQVGNVGYRVIDVFGAVKIARTTEGITEQVDASDTANTGLYEATATFDTTWAFPVKVIADITGADGVVTEESIGDEIPYLAAQFAIVNETLATIAAGIGQFTGAIPVTLTLCDADGNPVPYVRFSVPGQGTATTGANGQAIVNLNYGVYTVQASPTSGVMWIPQAFTVAVGHTSFWFDGTAVVIPSPPDDPGLCTAYICLLMWTGPEYGTATITELPQSIGGLYLIGDSFPPAKVNMETGQIVFPPLPKGAKVEFKVPATGYKETIPLPTDAGTLQL